EKARRGRDEQAHGGQHGGHGRDGMGAAEQEGPERRMSISVGAEGAEKIPECRGGGRDRVRAYLVAPRLVPDRDRPDDARPREENRDPHARRDAVPRHLAEGLAATLPPAQRRTFGADSTRRSCFRCLPSCPAMNRNQETPVKRPRRKCGKTRRLNRSSPIRSTRAK